MCPLDTAQSHLCDHGHCWDTQGHLCDPGHCSVTPVCPWALLGHTCVPLGTAESHRDTCVPVTCSAALQPQESFLWFAPDLFNQEMWWLQAVCSQPEGDLVSFLSLSLLFPWTNAAGQHTVRLTLTCWTDPNIYSHEFLTLILGSRHLCTNSGYFSTLQAQGWLKTKDAFHPFPSKSHLNQQRTHPYTQLPRQLTGAAHRGLRAAGSAPQQQHQPYPLPGQETSHW